MDHYKFGDYKRKNEKAQNIVGSDEVLEAFIQRQLEWQTFYRNHESFMNTLRWIHTRVKTPIMEESENEVGITTSRSSRDSLSRNRSLSSPDIKKTMRVYHPDSSDILILRNKKCRRHRSAEVGKDCPSPSLLLNSSASESKANYNKDMTRKTLNENLEIQTTIRAPKERKITVPDGHSLASQNASVKKRSPNNSSNFQSKGVSVKPPRRKAHSKDHHQRELQNEPRETHNIYELKLPPLDATCEQVQPFNHKGSRKKKISVKFPPINSDRSSNPAWK